MKYHESQPDEFNRLFNLWNDREYLRAFCKEHEDKPEHAFRQHVTVNEAADNIADEAALLEKQTALFFDIKSYRKYSDRFIMMCICYMHCNHPKRLQLRHLQKIKAAAKQPRPSHLSTI
jgi:hypothetical protein